MAKLLSLLVLVLIFVLLIPTGLVLASQNSVQGEAMYPVKRNLEQGILMIAGLTPWTKAYFQVGLSDRRFREVKTLIARGDNAAATLAELLVQTNTAVNSIEQVSSSSQKIELQQKLLTQLTQYDQALVTLENQQVTTNPNFIEPSVNSNGDPFVFENSPPAATSPKPSPTLAPVIVPTSAPSPAVSSIPAIPSPSVATSAVPSVATSVATSPRPSPSAVIVPSGPPSLTAGEIKKAKEEIKKIEERVRKEAKKDEAERKEEKKKEQRNNQKSDKKEEQSKSRLPDADVVQSEP